MSFSPQIGERGDLFPIRKYLDSSIFLPTSVNHTQDLMCFKYKANFNYKLHPNAYGLIILTTSLVLDLNLKQI